jgi:hypothetical protein
MHRYYIYTKYTRILVRNRSFTQVKLNTSDLRHDLNTGGITVLILVLKRSEATKTAFLGLLEENGRPRY